MKTSVQGFAQCVAMATAISQPVLADEQKSGQADSARTDVQFKVLYIVDGIDNGYDPNTGSGYLLKLKHETASWNSLRLGLGFYDAGDFLNLTDFNEAGKKVARGLFVTNDGDENALLGEAYLRYSGNDFTAHAGREHYKTPLTTILASTMPNLYTVAGVSTSAVTDTKITLDQIVQMSYGARAMTDFGLIGEGTGTAGATVRPDTIGQADFHRINEVSLGAGSKETNGVTVFGITWSGLKRVAGFKKIDLALWNYYSDDIANNLYLQADAVYPMDGMKLKLGAQYLAQSDSGDSLAGNLDFAMSGLKAALAGKGWSVFGALNQSSGDTGFFNAYGSDPGYTSTIFSRNQYRKNVDAYQVGFKYKYLKSETLKPFTVIAKYANYGKSESVGRVGGVGSNLTALEDADELDLIWIYKPPQLKGLALKLFTVWRTSEYNGSNGKELKQQHTRFIANMKF